MLPEANLIVISFVETPWEPKFLNNIKLATKAFNGRFYLWDDIREMPEDFWSGLDIYIIFVVSWRYMIPSKIYNIFASGKPIVASVDSGTEVERLILEADAGLVVAPDEPDAFHEAIQKLLDDPSLRKKMGQSAQKWTKNFYSAEAVSKLYVEGIKELKTNNKKSLP